MKKKRHRKVNFFFWDDLVIPIILPNRLCQKLTCGIFLPFFGHFGNFWPKFQFSPQNRSESPNKLYIARKDLKKCFEKIGAEISALIFGLAPWKFGAFLKLSKPQLNFLHNMVHKCPKTMFMVIKFFAKMLPCISFLLVHYIMIASLTEWTKAFLIFLNLCFFWIVFRPKKFKSPISARETDKLKKYCQKWNALEK